MSEGMLCWFAENAQNISLHSVYYNDIALMLRQQRDHFTNVFANGLVVYKYYQTRARQPVSNTLLFLLASLDLVKASWVNRFSHRCIFWSLLVSFHCTLENVTKNNICLSGFSFIMVTIVLTSERFFAIVFPIYHRVYMRKKVLIYLTLSLFVVWAILSMTFYLILPRLTQLCSVYISIYHSVWSTHWRFTLRFFP